MNPAQRILTAALLAAFAACAVSCDARAQVRKDEEVVFFPTYTWYEAAAPAPRWVVDVHAWIFQPASESMKRRAALSLLRKGLGLEEGGADADRFEERAGWFIADSAEGRALSVRFGDQTHELGAEAGETGHLRSRLFGWKGKEGDLCGELKLRPGWIRFEAVLGEGDARKFTGEALFLAEEGVSVVSDVDDTIKVSEVRDKRALIENTFLKEYQAVEGMGELYRALAEKGAAFHYVSASPWQLYPPLRQFMDAKGYPAGTYHMRDFALGHSEFFELFKSPEKWKPPQIEPLLERFPKRRFLLVGDSGEKDPEIYGDIARKYPDRVAGIFIRNVTGETEAAERFAKAFEGVPRERWALFTDPKDVRARVLETAK